MNEIFINKGVRLLLVILIFLTSGCDSGLLYKGDGDLDNGILFYPTFRVRFDKINISNENNVSVKFRGVPSDELSLRLELSNGIKINSNKIKSQTFFKIIDESIIKLSVGLYDGDELVKEVITSSLTSNWTYASIGNIYYFWNQEFTNIRLNPDIHYEMKISTKIIGHPMQTMYLTPILEGGGFGKGDIFR